VLLNATEGASQCVAITSCTSEEAKKHFLSDLSLKLIMCTYLDCFLAFSLILARDCLPIYR
jgi:hypothetical protein